jgi:hypothetical protein
MTLKFVFTICIRQALPTGRQAHSAVEWANFFMNDAGFYMACFLNNLTTSPGSLKGAANFTYKSAH